MANTNERGDDAVVLGPTALQLVNPVRQGLRRGAWLAHRYDGVEPLNVGAGDEIRISDFANLVAE